MSLLPLICLNLCESFVYIESLTGSNYKKWRSDIELALDLMDLDMCVLAAKPSVFDGGILLTDLINERSNRLSLMAIKHTISETIFCEISSS